MDITHAQTAPTDVPLVVSYGSGVDSTAMLVEMYNRGIRPDLILFADTGAEKPTTYAYLFTIQAWLERVGFPSVTIVRYVPPRAPYDSLEGNCTVNETLPSLAFGMHSCSLKWKAAPQERFLKSWEPAQRAWAGGAPIVRAIGYDDSARDRKRSEKAKAAKPVTMAIGLDDGTRDRQRSAKRYAKQADNELFSYWYPLQAWGIDREKCAEVIRAAGLPVPCKSSCFFCPAMKKEEIHDLAEQHPDLARRALVMEQGFLTGRHTPGGVPRSTKGLGRTFAWRELIGDRV